MQKKKKASIWSTLQGLIIFAILLVALIIFVRNVTQERGVDKTKVIKELEQVMMEVSEYEGAIRHRLEIGDDSAIIAYAANKDAIILNFEITSSDLQRFHPGLQRKFPEGNNDAMKSFLESHNVKGLIKLKPQSCLSEKTCLCYCEDIRFETDPTSTYNSYEAYMFCKSETCLETDQNIASEVYLKKFFEEIDYKYRPFNEDWGTSTEAQLMPKIQPQPELDTIHWDGGFIVMRTNKDISTLCHVIVVDASGRLALRNLPADCEKLYREGPVRNYRTFVLSPTIAGYRRNLVMRFIDIELEHKNGIITPRLI